MQERENARAFIDISQDRLTARIKLSAPGKEGRGLTREEIMDLIHEHNITTGIHEKYVNRLVKFPVYDIYFLIAAGKAPINGKDGQLVCHFETEKGGLVIDENGMVDFKNLAHENQVHKDDLLADIIPPTQGEDGYTIFGETVPAKAGNPVIDPAGNNTYLSEDGLKIYSAINGNAILQNGKISVQEIMNVNNVDYSTGNIVFTGDVNVKGDVRSGFSVHAGGSITVMGNVEDTVILEAEHDIVLRKGVNGKNGHITANGDLRAGYIQHAEVKVKNNVFADSIINSNIQCGGNMHLSGKNGRVVGGTCQIGGDLIANEIGNSANIYTVIELIGPYKLLLEKTKMEEKMEELEKTLQKIETTISNLSNGKSNEVDSRKNLLKLMLAKKQLTTDIAKLKEQMDLISARMEKQTIGKVQVQKDLHMNIRIDIDGIVLHNIKSRGRCRVYQKDYKIVVDE
ncbi:MAG: DUF342 domain-containing protein [Epulopiscium sp.]|nr:DUF342 domain-containing protein [Candidatus Epulonipiscium sp.]